MSQTAATRTKEQQKQYRVEDTGFACLVLSPLTQRDQGQAWQSFLGMLPFLSSSFSLEIYTANTSNPMGIVTEGGGRFRLSTLGLDIQFCC